jgi:nucleotide-binding universal stress UspA family protein
MDLFKHILVVSWLTKHCENTIKFGISLSKKYKTELSVVHVMDTKWLQGWSIPMVSVEEEYKRDMEKRRIELHKIISAEKEKGLKIKEFVKEGNPSDIILQLIKDKNIDLLILRMHEQNPLERMLVGGGNDDIIRAQPCSIFLVNQKTCEMG